MNTFNDTYSVTELRHQTNKVLADVAAKGLIYLVRHSKTEAAVVNIDYLTALQQGYEDYLDTMEFDRTIPLKRIPLLKHKRGMLSKT